MATQPIESELSGLFFTLDQKTLLIAVQHPGKSHQTRQQMETQTWKLALPTSEGELFMQTRQVPVGSNWPSQQPNEPPKPFVIAIRRINSQQ